VGQQAFAVIRDAMKNKKMAGIGRVVMARRERVMLEPFGKGIIDTTQHYPYEIRSEDCLGKDCRSCRIRWRVSPIPRLSEK